MFHRFFRRVANADTSAKTEFRFGTWQILGGTALQTQTSERILLFESISRRAGHRRIMAIESKIS